ncbi:hypothetical protein AB0B45_40965 [Nonomuraea sp. NPDC049152]|uniref:hypothetical protein n=1 Tax=Nonomuraea sp. NPDC049152 TaxID=3154350 RepID=UPI0033F474F6
MHRRLTYLTVTNVFTTLRLLPMGDRDKDIEILALRHQITVLERQLGADSRVRFAPAKIHRGDIGGSRASSPHSASRSHRPRSGRSSSRKVLIRLLSGRPPRGPTSCARATIIDPAYRGHRPGTGNQMQPIVPDDPRRVGAQSSWSPRSMCKTVAGGGALGRIQLVVATPRSSWRMLWRKEGQVRRSRLVVPPLRSTGTAPELRAFCTSSERRETDLIAVYVAGHGEVLEETSEHVLLTDENRPDDIADALLTIMLARKTLVGTKVRRLLLMP